MYGVLTRLCGDCILSIVAAMCLSSSSSRADVAWVLAAVCLAGLAMPLSFTGPAVVLPLLREALGGSAVALHWATNAFMLSFGAALMAAGALADNLGRRPVFLGGIFPVWW